MKAVAAFLLIAVLTVANAAPVYVEGPSEVKEHFNMDATLDSQPLLMRVTRQFPPSFGGGGSLSASQAINFQGGVRVPVVGDVGGSFSGGSTFSGGGGFGQQG